MIRNTCWQRIRKRDRLGVTAVMATLAAGAAAGAPPALIFTDVPSVPESRWKPTSEQW